MTLSEDTLTITKDGDERRSTLLDDAATLAAYREHFGIELHSVPRLAG